MNISKITNFVICNLPEGSDIKHFNKVGIHQLLSNTKLGAMSKNMGSKRRMFLTAYIGAEVKNVRHFSSQTGNISEKNSICVKRLHREFSCIQTTSCTRN